MRVKICGMTNRADIEAAIDMGADALGFTLYCKSPRYVGPEDLPVLTKDLKPFVQRIAVTVNFSQVDIERLDDMWAFDAWQLHGDELPELCERLAPRRLIKSFGLPFECPESLAPNLADYMVEAFLLDKRSPQFGGTGQTFDWNHALEFKKKTDKPVILCGGLNPDNVASAIETVRPYAVDVCSGVESAPGKKDHAKMRDFIQICHHYAARIE